MSVRVGAESALLDGRTGQYFTLNAVGCAVWEVLADGETCDGIVQRLQGRFDVEPHVLRADIVRFLEELDRLGLVSRL